jgi:hypothetical protein
LGTQFVSTSQRKRRQADVDTPLGADDDECLTFGSPPVSIQENLKRTRSNPNNQEASVVTIDSEKSQFEPVHNTIRSSTLSSSVTTLTELDFVSVGVNIK